MPEQQFVELQALACRVESVDSFLAALLGEGRLVEAVVLGVVEASQEVAQDSVAPQAVQVEEEVQQVSALEEQVWILSLIHI